MGGVLHSFDQSLDPIKHLEAFDSVMKNLGLKNGDLNSKLEGEYRAIRNGDLVVYPITTGIENLKENMKTCKVVIVSMSPVKTSKLVLGKFGIEIDEIDFYNMADFGSKKDKNAWRQIFEKYESIDFIVEDGDKNLEAANEAAKDLGFGPKIFLGMPIVR